MPRNGKRFNRYHKNVGNALQVAQTALRLARHLKTLINVEFKRLDTVFGAAQSTTAVITPLSQLTQGDSVVNRDGQSVKIKSILLNGVITAHATPVSTQCKIIIFRWNNEATPVVADILSTVTDPLSQMNVDKSHLWKIIKTYFFVLGAAGAANHIKRLRFYKKLDIKSKYDNTGPTSFTSGSLWMLTLSDQASNTPTFDFRQRMRFVDN